ncbi:MAG: CaiB/BaiF CoA transferase family protein [Thermoanaerobaculia bacterium]
MGSQPLEGILIVDLSRYLPGPLAAKMLANLGARVIKIEEPELGDPVRNAPPVEGGVGSLARLLLSGVESVALDLTRAQARELLAAILKRADVLLESFRPGKLAEFGLAPEALGERYPGLVVCSVSGWGSVGPASGHAGHDLTYQAAAGALAATGEIPGLPAADLLGAFAAVSATTAALLARERSGRGTRIDASLFDAAAIGNLTNVAARAGAAGKRTALTGAFPCYRIYDTCDERRFALAALEPRFWKRFCAEVDRPDLTRHQYREDDASHQLVAELFATRDGEDWRELCHRADIPGDLVASVAEAAGSPQMAAREIATGEGRLPFPAILDGERPRAPAHFPALGEHTEAVLAEFGSGRVARGRRGRRGGGIGPRVTLRGLVRRWAADRFGD